MIIIEDERKDAIEITCYNCKRKCLGRRVPILDRYTREIREYRWICFECFGPRIHWRKNERGRDFWSPINKMELNNADNASFS